MRTLLGGLMLGALVTAAACAGSAAAGPNGGDVVPIKNGSAVAEVVSNPHTGEVIVQTYDRDLKNRRPIAPEPITVGNNQNSVDLMPHPTESDPPGTCSRFYGKAEWLRGGRIRQGWMQGRAMGARQEFGWEQGWEAGRVHDEMWEAIGEHRRMSPDHGPGSSGPMGHR